MANIRDENTGNGVFVDSNGTLQIGLYDLNGNLIFKTPGTSYLSTDRIMPMGGLSDNVWRSIRSNAIGDLASASFTPIIDYTIETTNIPSNFYSFTSSQTITTALATGTLLNASAIGTSGSYAVIESSKLIPKNSRGPLFLKVRARLIKGGINGTAEIGFANPTPGSAALIGFGFFFYYDNMGTLRPKCVFNTLTSVLGTDFSASISSSKYYDWEILVDDNYVRFIVSDPNTQTIITDQTLTISEGIGKTGQYSHFFTYARIYYPAPGVGTTFTQMYVADMMVGFVDRNLTKPYSHIQSGNFLNSLISPTTNLTQIANWSNSAAPSAATLANTASYSTMGGQFSFAAVAGAETDYALFEYQIPSPYSFYCTGIEIDTFNTGASGNVATPTMLTWALGSNSPSANIATSGGKIVTLGAQSFPSAVIGSQGQQINQHFTTPFVTDAGNYIQIIMKCPIGVATASQVFRGVVQIEGYFE